MPRVSKEEKAEAIQYLRESVREGDRVYVINRRRAPSGMSHCLSFIVFDETGPRYLTNLISRALGYTLVEVNGSEAVRIGGCGYDKAHHVVSHLARELFGSDKKLTREWL